MSFATLDAHGPLNPRRAQAIEDLNYGFIDQASSNYFLAQLNPAHDDAGEFTFSAWGLGVFTSAQRGAVTVDQAGVTHFSFSGPANLNAGATWYRALALDYVLATSNFAVTVQLTATIQPGFTTATAALVYNGQTYTVAAQAPPHDADVALTAAMTAFVNRDWHAFYLASDSRTIAETTEAEFTTAALASEPEHGVLSSWALIGSLVYKGEPGLGFHTAVGSLKLKYTLNGLATRYRASVVLLEDAGQWRLFTIDDPAPSLNVFVNVPTNGTATSSATDPATSEAGFAFTGVAGQRYSARITSATVTTGNALLSGPSSVVSGTIAGGKVFFDAFPGESGVYELVVIPDAGQSGQVTAEVFTVTEAAGTITPGGPAVPVTLSVPGQNGALSLSAVAGQQVTVVGAGSTLSSATLKLVRPDGTVQASSPLTTSGGTIASQTIATSGTYSIVVDPAEDRTGSVSISLQVPGGGDVVGTVTPGGTPVTVTVPISGGRARLYFDGSVGQRVSLNLTGSTISGGQASVRRPDDTSLTSSYFGTTATFIDPVALTSTGTHSILIDPSGTATGTVTVQLYDVPADPGGAIAAGGAAQQYTTTVPGQNVGPTFSGTAGQRVSVETTGTTMYPVYLRVLKPDGSSLGYTYFSGATGFLDVLTLPTSGTYTVQLDPVGTKTGTATVQLYDVPADPGGTIAAGGAAQQYTTTVPGQNVGPTFSGTAGQRISAEATGSTLSPVYLRVLKPDGSSLGYTYFSGATGFLDVLTLPTSGTYTVQLDPLGTKTGTATVQLYDVPADPGGAIAAGGVAQQYTTTVPGQNVAPTFSGTAGQRVSVETTGATMYPLYLRVLKPDGSSLGSTYVSGATGFLDVLTLPTSGIYTVQLDPLGTKTGTATVQLYDVPADPGGAIAAGGVAQQYTTTVPGQNVAPTFSGTAGQRVSVETTGTTMYPLYLRVLKPDGSSLGSTYVSGATGFLDVLTLPTSGTYTVQLDPLGTKTGTATVQLYDVPADPVQSITAGGASVIAIVAVPGQNSRLTFAGASGQKIAVQTSGNTATPFYIRLLKPDGSTLSSTYVSGTTGSTSTQTLPSAGTYTIVIDPIGAPVGSSAVQLVNVP